MPTAIVGAMPEEVDAIAAALTEARPPLRSGDRLFRVGLLAGRPVVVVLSRIGKVAAAATLTELIITQQVSRVLMVGVAGAIDPALRIGDIVVARRFAQHDMDASPIFPPFEIPMLGRAWFDADPCLSEHLRAASDDFLTTGLSALSPALARFGISPSRPPRLLEGDIASGDRFISSHAERDRLRALLPTIRCVDMESAAAAQICHEYAVPLGVVRVVSDTADDGAHIDFARFIAGVASGFAVEIARRTLQRLPP